MTPSENIVTSCRYCGPTCAYGTGKCHCGCDENTGTAEKAYIRWGMKRGDHFKYAHGHHGRSAAHPRLPNRYGEMEGNSVVFLYVPTDQWAVVDLEDESAVSGLWYNHNGYAGQMIPHRKSKRKRRLMQHAIVGRAPRGWVWDHKNGKRMDNRKNNLRLIPDSKNGKNRGINRNNTSGITGVYWKEDARRWIAVITVDWVKIVLGRFLKFSDAVNARREAEKKYFGEFAREKIWPESSQA